MTGVILINFGGPRTTGEIGPFLQDILKDVLPSPLKPFAGLFARLRLSRVKKMYDAIGGTSPVVDWTTKQAQALETKLCRGGPPWPPDLVNSPVGEGLCLPANGVVVGPLPKPREPAEGLPYKTYIAMKYGEPSIEEAVTGAKKDGCEKNVLLPLFPYQSKYTSMSLRLSAGRLAEAPHSGAWQSRELSSLDCLAHARNDKLYIHCMVDIIKTALSEWRDIPPPQVTLLFTAHSIPSCSAKNEPYVRQINDSTSKIMGHFTGYNYQIAYQSAPFRLGWLGPDVKSAIRQIKTKYLLIIPLGFACENLETLYELDRLYLPYAKIRRMNVKRTPALNDNPIFIDLLAELVLGNRSSTLYLSAFGGGCAK